MITNQVLLIFFALPIAVIIISVALQRILKNPILVALVVFAIFVIDNIQFLVATIAYTILSYITAFLTYIIYRFLKEHICTNNNSNNNNVNTISNDSQQNNCGCNNNQVSGLNGISARINIIPNNNGDTGRINGCYRNR